MTLQTSTPRKFVKVPDFLSADPTATANVEGPAGFHWLICGVLGGTPFPGTTQTLDEDIAALKRMGTDLLVTLTSNLLPPIHQLDAHKIRSLHVKIPDMSVPSTAVALSLCNQVDGYLSRGSTCVFHCRAGLGRTGTMLAAQLIYYGVSAEAAIQYVRYKNPKWIETQEQLEFLSEFEKCLE